MPEVVTITVGHADLLGPDCKRLTTAEVPLIPAGADRWVDGSGDVVYQHGDRRWRFRRGRLMFFCVYQNKRPLAFGDAWSEAWTTQPDAPSEADLEGGLHATG